MGMLNFKVGDRVVISESAIAHYGACGTIVDMVASANAGGGWLHIRIDGNDPDIDYTVYAANEVAPALELEPLLEHAVGA